MDLTEVKLADIFASSPISTSKTVVEMMFMNIYFLHTYY